MQEPDWFRLQKGIDNKIARLEKENAELRQQVDLFIEEMNNSDTERGKLLMQQEQLLEALSSLLDGLDSNLDERCGLSNEEWEYTITTARQTLGSIRRQKKE